MSFDVFVNQIYVETTGDLFVLNGDTVHGTSAEFLPPLDEISNGPFLPKAQFTFFFSHSTLQGWAVMENWLKKKKAFPHGHRAVMDNLAASTLSSYFRRSHQVASKAVLYSRAARAWLTFGAFIIICYPSRPFIFSLTSRDGLHP